MTFVARVCAVIVRGDAVMMVRHVHDGRDYWTLPGGAVEEGETAEQAVLREVAEEVTLVGTVERRLYVRTYLGATGVEVRELCFQVAVDPGAEAVLGFDPELTGREQLLTALAWRPLAELRDDRQLSLAWPALES